MVFNNTRVIQARLHFRKPTGANIEIFLLEPHNPADYEQVFQTTRQCEWVCLIGNAKKWKDGDLTLSVPSVIPSSFEGAGETAVTATRLGEYGIGHIVRFQWTGDNSFANILEAVGELPIPPYLNRDTQESDKTTYQTVYSRIKGSVAAPTAGLHFTQSVLDDLRQRGIETDEVTLHVGAGTFLPVKTADANEHTMHTEIIAVPKSAIEHIIAKLGKIVAVGTTSMRTLESLYWIGCQLRNVEMSKCRNVETINVSQFEPYEREHTLSTHEALQAIVDYLDATGQQVLHAETQIMIKPGYQFHIVDQLITNFHQPQSTLLLLVSAFVGGDWHTIYDYALSHDFRFLSYGDSSILTKHY